jgi:hypothetical protein
MYCSHFKPENMGRLLGVFYGSIKLHGVGGDSGVWEWGHSAFADENSPGS